MFPKKGRKLHSDAGVADLAIALSLALKAELGESHRAVKTVMRWTGASERTVKHWFAATHVPKGKHMVSLARHSDEALRAILSAAGRTDIRIAMELGAVRMKLVELIELLDGT